MDVVYDLPGRVRSYVDAIVGDRMFAGQVTDHVSEVAGVCSATANHLSGSILITCDPGQISLQDLADNIRRMRREAEPLVPSGQCHLFESELE